MFSDIASIILSSIVVVGTYSNVVHPIGSPFGHNILKIALSKMKMIPPIGKEPVRQICSCFDKLGITDKYIEMQSSSVAR